MIPTDLLIRYSQKFGSTFDSLHISNPEVEKEAIAQMEACLDGSRTAPVTNQSIGLVQGEGVYE